MSLIDTIDRESLKGASKADLIRQRKEFAVDVINGNKALQKAFVGASSDGKRKIKNKIYKQLQNEIPAFGQYKVGEQEVVSYYSMWPGGTGEPTVTGTKDITTPLYDDETEEIYEYVNHSDFNISDLDMEDLLYIGPILHQRKSSKAKQVQAIARRDLHRFIEDSPILDETTYADPESRRQQMLEGATKPFTDFGMWVGEKMGADFSDRKVADALENLAYPDNVKHETWGEIIGMLGVGVGGYSQLAKHGLARTFSKHGGKLALRPAALASVAGLEFGIGAAYNQPSLLLQDMEPHRIVSGLEAMAIGSAFGLGVDAVMPMKGLNYGEAMERVRKMTGAKFESKVKDLMTESGGNRSKLRRMLARKQEVEGGLARRGELVSTTKEAAKTEEYAKMVQIEDAIKQVDQNLKEVRGMKDMAQEEKTLKLQRHKLHAENVRLNLDPPMTKWERMAEEAMPGSVLGITPYAAFGNMSREELEVLLMKEATERVAGGGAMAMFSPYAEEEGGLKAFMLGSLLWPGPAARMMITPPKYLNDAIQGGDRLIKPLTQRLHDSSPYVYNMVMKKELDQLQDVTKVGGAMEPFFKTWRHATSKMPWNNKFQMDATMEEDLILALANRDAAARESILNQVDPSGSWSTQFEDLAKAVDGVRDKAVLHKMDGLGYLSEYFPRFVDDVEGLKAHKGIVRHSQLESAYNDFAAKNNRPPTEFEKKEIANRVIGRRNAFGAPANTKERKFHQLDRSDLKYYAHPEKAMGKYVHDMLSYIHTRKSMGKYNPNIAQNYVTDIVDNSAGAALTKMFDDMVNNGTLDPKALDEVTDLTRLALLESRGGPNTFWNGYRNLFYATTIGNPISTLSQIPDIALAAYRDPGATKTALGNALQNKKFDVGTVDLGLNHVAHDIHSAGWTGRFLDRVTKASGFHQMDQLMKSIHSSSSYQRLRKAANSTGNKYQEFEKLYKARLGSDFDDFKDALKRGDSKNEHVQTQVFADLADIQPITVSGMPEAYIKARNGRIMYALKSFTLKQVNHIRSHLLRNVSNAKTKKAYAKAMGELALYGTLFAGTTFTANQLKDFILGRSVTMSDAAMDAMLQTMGLSKYSVYQWRDFRENKLFESIGRTFAPIGPAIKVGQDVGKLMSGEMEGIQDAKSLQHVPVGGKLLYWRLGEGSEKEARRQSTDSPFIEVDFGGGFDSGFEGGFN